MACLVPDALPAPPARAVISGRRRRDGQARQLQARNSPCCEGASLTMIEYRARATALLIGATRSSSRDRPPGPRSFASTSPRLRDHGRRCSTWTASPMRRLVIGDSQRCRRAAAAERALPKPVGSQATMMSFGAYADRAARARPTPHLRSSRGHRFAAARHRHQASARCARPLLDVAVERRRHRHQLGPLVLEHFGYTESHLLR